MEFRGELPYRDACAVARLRRILAGSARSADRDVVGLYCMAVIRNYLLRRCVHRRFGFDDPFDVVADKVAGMEAAILLDPDRVRFLRQALRRRLDGADPEDAPEGPLASAFRDLLRMRGHQGLEHEWMKRHRGEALLLRCLRVALPRVRGIRLEREARGRLLTTRASDLTREAIRREDLASALRICAPDFQPRRIGVELREILRPDGRHGGYCFLMDLVRAVHSIRTDLVRGDPSETGAAPSPDRSMIERNRLRHLGAQILRFLLDSARDIDRSDLAKDRRKKDPRAAAASPEAREARVIVAVEILMEEIGLGKPEREKLSLADRLATRLPEEARDGSFRMHVNRTDYILGRLRIRLRRFGPVLVDTLWRRWWIEA